MASLEAPQWTTVRHVNTWTSHFCSLWGSKTSCTKQEQRPYRDSQTHARRAVSCLAATCLL